MSRDITATALVIACSIAVIFAPIGATTVTATTSAERGSVAPSPSASELPDGQESLSSTLDEETSPAVANDALDWNYTGKTKTIKNASVIGDSGYQETSEGGNYVLSSNGGYVLDLNNSYYVTDAHDVTSAAQGFYRDGSSWYIVSDDSGPTVYEYDSSFSQTGSWDLSSVADKSKDIHKGDDGHWYVLDPDNLVNPKIIEFDSSFNYVTNYTISEPNGYQAIEQRSDGSWWVMGDDGVYLYNDTFAYQGTSHTLDESSGKTQGLDTSISGDRWIMIDESGNIYWYERALAEGDISGKVVDQSGEPVASATVEILGVDRSELDVNSSEIETRAEELRQRANNMTPESWDPDRKLNNAQLDGQDGFYDTEIDDGGSYVAMHTPSEWAMGPHEGGEYITPQGEAWLEDPNLAEPRGDNPATSAPHLQIREGKVVFSVWGTGNNDGLEGTIGVDPVSNQLPGGVNDDRAVVVERLGPDGSVVNNETLEQNGAYSSEVGAWKHEHVTTYLQKGFYRVYPEGSPESSITVVVGTPDKIFSGYASNLQNQAGELSERAQWIRENIENDKFERISVATDSDGEWDANVPSNIETVSVSAHKGPYEQLGKSPGNVSMKDLRSRAESITDVENLTATDVKQASDEIYIPTESKTVDVPKQGITLRTESALTAPWADISTQDEAREKLEEIVGTESFEEIGRDIQEQVEENREEAEERVQEIDEGICAENPSSELCQRRDELLDDGEGIPNGTAPSNATVEELREELQAQEQAIRELRDTLEPDEPNVDPGEETVNLTFPFNADLNPDSVSVLVEYSNGTIETLGTDSEFVSVDDNVPGVDDDAVHIRNFPMGGENGSSVANFEVLGVGEEGAAKVNQPVANPAIPGEPPGIEAVKLTSLRPGPDQLVTMRLDPDDETSITNVSSVDITGPEGSNITPTIDGQNVEFVTNGGGVHTARVTFETSDGRSHVFTQQLVAGEQNIPMPPAIRVSSTPYGRVAVVGDGLETGEVSVDGEEIGIVGTLNSDDDLPNDPIHIHLTDADLPQSADATVRLTRGSDQEAVSAHVPIVVHLTGLPDPDSDQRTTIYRDDQALPRTGENRWGEVQNNGTATTIRTITDQEGSVTITTTANAGIVDYWSYRVDLFVPDDFPVVTFQPAPLMAATPPTRSTAVGIWTPLAPTGSEQTAA
jgi:hypothetical protein